MNKQVLITLAAILFTAINSSAQKAKDSDEQKKSYDVNSDYLLDFSNFNWGADTAKKEPVKTETKTKDKESGYYLLDFSEYDSKNTSAKTVTIGKQTWMAENLNIAKFKNGDAIPEAKTEEEWLNAGKAKKPAWCYYKNDPANGDKYGRLYNWYAVNDSRSLAPDGWHIPTEDEWNTLIYQLGGESAASGKMRSTTGWKEGREKSTNESGFNGLPSACRDHYAYFYEPESTAYFWTSTPFITGSAGYAFKLGWYGIVAKNIYDNDALSVRCVKN